MSTSCLSRRLCSVTALAVPLTLFVPTYEPLQGANYAPLPEARVYNSLAKLPASHAPRHTLLTRDVSSAPGGTAKLDIRLNRANSKFVSMMLVCAQGGLIISDGVRANLLNNHDHIIDITNWDLDNISVNQIEKTARRILFTVVVTSASSLDGPTSSETGSFEVNFVDAAQNRDTTYPDAVSRDPGVPVHLDTSLSTSPFDVFVAEAPIIESRELGNSSSRDDDQASNGPSNTDSDAPRIISPAQISKEAVSPSPPNIEVGVLMSRARGLIQRGDISSARLLLEHARTRNAPEAIFLLAQTYDPERLRAWKVYGLRADPDLARDLYARAAEQGYADARRLAVMSR